MTLLIGLGEGYASAGRLREAELVLNEALSLAEQLDQKAAKASVLLQQGHTRIGLSLYREANEFTRQALEVFREVKDGEGEVLARIQLGAGEVALGNYAGIDPLVEMLEAESPASYVAVIAWGLVGWAHVLQGRYAEGIAALERALDEQEQTGDLRQRAMLERRLGWAHFGQGRFDQAFAMATRARIDFRQVGDLPGEAKANIDMGLARIAQGQHSEGLELVGRTLDALRMTADAHCEAEALWALGRAHSGAGRNAQAATLLQRSLEMLRVIGDRDGELRVLVDLTRLRLAEVDYRSAEQTADLAIAIAQQLKSRDGLGAALAERSRARLATGRIEEAVSEGEEAVALLEETRSGDLWRGYWALARALDEAGKDDPRFESGRPVALLERALAALTEMRDQIDPGDAPRRSAFTRAHSGPARDLHTLLLHSGRTIEAQAIAQDWLNGSVA